MIRWVRRPTALNEEVDQERDGDYLGTRLYNIQVPPTSCDTVRGYFDTRCLLQWPVSGKSKPKKEKEIVSFQIRDSTNDPLFF